MPINQPTQYVPYQQRNTLFANFMPGLATAATEGMKDLFGNESPQERYMDALAADAEQKRVAAADQEWRTWASQPGHDPNNMQVREAIYRKHLVSDDVLDAAMQVPTNYLEDRLRRTANYSLNEMNEQEMQHLGQMDAERGFPLTLPEQPAPQGDVRMLQGTPSTDPAANPAPPSPAIPVALSNVERQAQQAVDPPPSATGAPATPAESPVQSSAESPGQPGMAPATVGGTPVSAGTPQRVPLDPDRRKALQASFLRTKALIAQQAQLNVAATTGVLDPAQTQQAAGLANLTDKEVTSMLQNALPALGADPVDRDGNPLGADMLFSYRAWLQLNQDPLTAAELKKYAPAQYEEMSQLAQKFDTALKTGKLPMSIIDPLTKAVSHMPSTPPNVLLNMAQFYRSQDETERANRARESMEGRKIDLASRELDLQTETARAGIALTNEQIKLAKWQLGSLARKEPFEMANLKLSIDAAKNKIQQEAESHKILMDTRQVANLSVLQGFLDKRMDDMIRMYGLSLNAKEKNEATILQGIKSAMSSLVDLENGIDMGTKQLWQNALADILKKNPGMDRVKAEEKLASINSSYAAYRETKASLQDALRLNQERLKHSLEEDPAARLGSFKADAATAAAQYHKFADSYMNTKILPEMRKAAVQQFRDNPTMEGWLDIIESDPTALGLALGTIGFSGGSLQEPDATSVREMETAVMVAFSSPNLTLSQFEKVTSGGTTLGQILKGRTRQVYNLYKKISQQKPYLTGSR